MLVLDLSIGFNLRSTVALYVVPARVTAAHLLWSVYLQRRRLVCDLLRKYSYILTACDDIMMVNRQPRHRYIVGDGTVIIEE